MTPRKSLSLVATTACLLLPSMALAVEPSGAFCDEAVATWAAHQDDCGEMAKAWSAVNAKYRPIVEKSPEDLDLEHCEKAFKANLKALTACAESPTVGAALEEFLAISEIAAAADQARKAQAAARDDLTLAEDLDALCAFTQEAETKIEEAWREKWVSDQMTERGLSARGVEVMKLLASSAPDARCAVLEAAAREVGTQVCTAMCPLLAEYGPYLEGIRLPSSRSEALPTAGVATVMMLTKEELLLFGEGALDTQKNTRILEMMELALAAHLEGQVVRLLVDHEVPIALLAEVVAVAMRTPIKTVELQVARAYSLSQSGTPRDAAGVEVECTLPITASQPDANSFTVVLSASGFDVRDASGAISPIVQCTGRTPKVTVCLRDPEEENLLERYDWLALYNLMMELVEQNPTSGTLFVEAKDDVSVGVLVRLGDTLRWRRVDEAGGPEGTGQQFASAEELNSSQPTYTALFDRVSLIPPKQP